MRLLISMNRISRCSRPRAWAAFWSLQRPSLVCAAGWRLLQKITRESSCEPLHEWFGRPIRVKIWSGCSASRRLKKLPVLPSRRLAVERAQPKQRFIAAIDEFATAQKPGALKPSSLQRGHCCSKTRPTRADAREACACQRHLRRRRCAKSAARAPRYAHARCADATDAVATARAPRWRARAATPSSSRPTTV